MATFEFPPADQPVIAASSGPGVIPDEGRTDIETVQSPKRGMARLAGRQLTSGEATFDETGGDLFAVGEAQAQQRLEMRLYEKSSFDGTFSRDRLHRPPGVFPTTSNRARHLLVRRERAGLLRRFWAHLGQVRPSLVHHP